MPKRRSVSPDTASVPAPRFRLEPAWEDLGSGARWETVGGDSWTEAEARDTRKTSGEDFNPPPRVRAASAVDAGQ